MAKLTCKNFGFECNFEIEENDESKLVDTFSNHVSLEHKTSLSKESLLKMISGNQVLCPYCNSEFASKELLSKHIDKIHHGSGILEGL